MKRTRFEQVSMSHVILHAPNGCTFEYWTPLNGGYVRELSDNRPGTLGRQVCDYLANTGSTLWRSEATPLVDIVKREYRRFCKYDRQAFEMTFIDDPY